MLEPSEIKKLAELFSIQKKDSDSEDDCLDNNPCTEVSQNVKQTKPYEKLKETPKVEKKNLDNIDPDNEKEFLLDEETNVYTDWKKSPQWDITYKQQVTPTDVFLQMGGKSAATASCEDMILNIHLPGEKYQNIDLKITKERMNLDSPRFKLDIPLPHPVNPQHGNAQWDKDNEKLIITLRMDREFDYINF